MLRDRTNRRRRKLRECDRTRGHAVAFRSRLTDGLWRACTAAAGVVVVVAVGRTRNYSSPRLSRRSPAGPRRWPGRPGTTRTAAARRDADPCENTPFPVRIRLRPQGQDARRPATTAADAAARAFFTRTRHENDTLRAVVQGRGTRIPHRRRTSYPPWRPGIKRVRVAGARWWATGRNSRRTDPPSPPPPPPKFKSELFIFRARNL